MGKLRDRILKSLRADWEACEASGCLPESTVATYMRATCEASPRIRVKKAFLSVANSETETGGALAECLNVIYEAGNPSLYGEALAATLGLDDAHGQSKRSRNKHIRQQLAEMLDDAQRLTSASAGNVRELAEAILDANPSKGDVCLDAMECHLDALTGDAALGSTEDRAAMLERLRTDTSNKKKMKSFVTTWPNGKPEPDFLEELVENMLVRKSMMWFDNAGESFADDGGYKSVSHTAGIPIDLIEICLEKDRELAAVLDTGRKAGTAPNAVDDRAEMREWARDVMTLYMQLLEESSGDAMVPLMINAKTGLGLYLLGANYGRQTTNLRVLFAVFGKRVGTIDKPFFALMYHGSVARFNFEHTTRVELGSGEWQIQIEGLWEDVISAWIPTKQEIDTLGLERSVQVCIVKAYRSFTDWATEFDSSMAFRDVNYPAPKGCPERFLPYFEQGAPYPA